MQYISKTAISPKYTGKYFRTECLYLYQVTRLTKNAITSIVVAIFTSKFIFKKGFSWVMVHTILFTHIGAAIQIVRNGTCRRFGLILTEKRIFFDRIQQFFQSFWFSIFRINRIKSYLLITVLISRRQHQCFVINRIIGIGRTRFSLFILRMNHIDSTYFN